MNQNTFVLRHWIRCAAIVFCAVSAGFTVSFGQALPPPPVPPQNPITEEKRVLGKILFWDEQLSSNDTVACGSCHRAASGGSDPRIGINAGPDTLAPSPDDVFGSPGVPLLDAAGMPLSHPVFGTSVQVTGRSSVSTINAAYAPEMFWDGRARQNFVDPETGLVSIPLGGALENQAIGPILSDVEMARQGRSWNDVRAKLERALPLRDATNLPADIASVLSHDPSYPELFASAFGDPAITAERIAHAVATYERTLIANQTPWDSFIAGNAAALTPGQTQGWNFFNNSPCRVCHTPPQFTNNTFRNIGMRPPAEDLGRQIVTGNAGDRGRFKVPTLRNVGLKPTHMHNGHIATVQDSTLWYRPNNPDRFVDNLDPILPVGVPPQVLPALVDFLTNGLTDPRVAAETFPFDRPAIHGGQISVIGFDSDKTSMSWPALEGVVRYSVYRGDLADLLVTGQDGLPADGYGICISAMDSNPGDTTFIDPEIPEVGAGFFYLKSVIDGRGDERGLGATRDGAPRGVAAFCPAP